MSDTLIVYEETSAAGPLIPVGFRVTAGALSVVHGGAAIPLPEEALVAVFRRFGRPLEAGEPVTEVATLAIAGGTLRHLRHLARFDVIARDYVTYAGDGVDEELCAIAPTIAGACLHLARAHARA